MTETVEIKPRYVETIEKTQPSGESHAKTSALSTMCENKLLVLVIVMVIIVVAILAYIFYSRSETVEPKKPEPRPVVAQSGPPITRAVLANIRDQSLASDNIDCERESDAAVPAEPEIEHVHDAEPEHKDASDAELMHLMDDDSESNDAPKNCGYILTNGKTCRNKATVSGFCRKHTEDEE